MKYKHEPIEIEDNRNLSTILNTAIQGYNAHKEKNDEGGRFVYLVEMENLQEALKKYEFNSSKQEFKRKWAYYIKQALEQTNISEYNDAYLDDLTFVIGKLETEDSELRIITEIIAKMPWTFKEYDKARKQQKN